MSFKRNFFKSISTFAAYNYTSQALEFLSTIILSRLLLPEEYGFVAMVLIPAGFVDLFSSVGIKASIIRSDYGETFHRHLNGIAFLLGILLSLGLIIVAWPMALFFENMNLILPTILLSLKFIIDSFSYVPLAILAKNLQFNIIGKTKLYTSGFQILLTIVLAYAGFSYWALVIPMVVSPVVHYLYIRNKVSVKFRWYGLKATRRVFGKIRSLTGILYLKNLIGYWTVNFDKLIIGKLFTEADLGIYIRALKFVSLSNKLITNIFGTVLFPSLKQLIEKKGNVTKEYLDMLRILTFFNLPLMIILVFFPYNLVYYLWGNDWIQVSVYLPYVSIILLYRSLMATMSSVFILFGKEKTLLLVTFIKTMVTIALVLAGAFFSILHILIFLALGYVFLLMPLNVYFGFYRSFGFSLKRIFYFILPNLFFGFFLFASIFYELPVFKIIVFVIYAGFLAYELRSSIRASMEFLVKKITKTL